METAQEEGSVGVVVGAVVVEPEKEVKPLGYHLLLQPVVGRREWAEHNNTLYGRATLKLSLLKEGLNTIHLHALRLTFSSAALRIPISGDPVSDVCVLIPSEIKVDEAQEVVSFVFDRELPAATPLELTMHYTAPIYTKGEFRGVYECPFLETPEGDEEYVPGCVTHFEPCDSRRAFPCIDCPNIKASFTVDVIAPSEYGVISNMPIETQDEGEEGGGVIFDLLFSQPAPQEGEKKVTWKRTTFQQSPPISSYLVCFIVGKFDYLEDTVTLDFNAVGEEVQTELKLRVYSPLGMKEEGQYTLNLMGQGLRAYCKEFRCGYPLPKLDIIAVGHLDAIAMENWGAMVFLQDYTLVSEDTPFSRRQRIARLVFHEVLHQWMGNLVSIQSWKYLWLKEGFARYLEYVLVDRFFPEWNYWVHFLTDIYSVALGYDENLQKTHPVEVEIAKARDIVDIFDSISYGKGASVLRMMAEYMGSDVMWNSLRLYMARHCYGATVTEDLFKAFEEISTEDVKIGALMEPWIKRPGHPIIYVEEKSFSDTEVEYVVRQYSSVLLDASRASSMIDPTDEDAALIAVPIPLLIRSPTASAASPHRKIISDAESSLSFPTLNTKREDWWINFNGRHSGFFRVCYSPALWKQVALSIERKQLTVAEIAGVVMDALALNQLHRSNPLHVGMDSVLSLLSALSAISIEEDRVYYSSLLPVWSLIVPKVGQWISLLAGISSDAHIKTSFFNYVKRLYSNLIAFIGFSPAEEGEPEVVPTLRGKVLQQLVQCGDKETMSQLYTKFEEIFQPYQEEGEEEEEDVEGAEERGTGIAKEKVKESITKEVKGEGEGGVIDYEGVGGYSPDELGDAVDVMLGVDDKTLGLMLICGVKEGGAEGYLKVKRLYITAVKSGFLLGRFASTLKRLCIAALWHAEGERERQHNLSSLSLYIQGEPFYHLPHPSDGWSSLPSTRDAIWMQLLHSITPSTTDSPPEDFPRPPPLDTAGYGRLEVGRKTKAFREVMMAVIGEGGWSEGYHATLEEWAGELVSRIGIEIPRILLDKKLSSLSSSRQWLLTHLSAFHSLPRAK